MSTQNPHDDTDSPDLLEIHRQAMYLHLFELNRRLRSAHVHVEAALNLPEGVECAAIAFRTLAGLDQVLTDSVALYHAARMLYGFLSPRERGCLPECSTAALSQVCDPELSQEQQRSLRRLLRNPGTTTDQSLNPAFIAAFTMPLNIVDTTGAIHPIGAFVHQMPCYSAWLWDEDQNDYRCAEMDTSLDALMQRYHVPKDHVFQVELPEP